jgi:hypothetical protein
MKIEQRYEKRYRNFAAGRSLDSFSSCLLSQLEDWPRSCGSDGRGFRIQRSDSPLARSSADMIELLSRIATQAAKLLKSERPDFSTGFCRLVDQSLKKKPAIRPAKFERIVAQLEND